MAALEITLYYVEAETAVDVGGLLKRTLSWPASLPMPREPVFASDFRDPALLGVVHELMDAQKMDEAREALKRWEQSGPAWIQVLWISIPKAMASEYMITDVKVGKNSQFLRGKPPPDWNSAKCDWSEYYGEIPASRFADDVPVGDMDWERVPQGWQFQVQLRKVP